MEANSWSHAGFELSHTCTHVYMHACMHAHTCTQLLMHTQTGYTHRQTNGTHTVQTYYFRQTEGTHTDIICINLIIFFNPYQLEVVYNPRSELFWPDFLHGADWSTKLHVYPFVPILLEYKKLYSPQTIFSCIFVSLKGTINFSDRLDTKSIEYSGPPPPPPPPI